MTYKEDLENGYKNGDTKIHRGYPSRKINIDNQRSKGCRWKSPWSALCRAPVLHQYSIHLQTVSRQSLT